MTEITAGFKGDVGVVPRQFLREFVTQMDLVDENEGYKPGEQYGFKPSGLNPEEQSVLTSNTGAEDSDADELVPMEDAW